MPETSEFSWGHAALRLDFLIDDEGRVRVVGVGPDAPVGAVGTPDGDAEHIGMTLVEAQLTGYGRIAACERAIGTVVGERLVYQGREESRDGEWLHLGVDLADPESGLHVRVRFRTPDGVGAVQTWAELTNRGDQRLNLESVTSLALGAVADRDGSIAGLDLWHADNEWLVEGRWQRRPLRSLLVDRNTGRQTQRSRSSVAYSSQGSWSAGRHLPMGAITDRDRGRALIWQVENPGGWRWEVGERGGAAYLAVLGPTDRDHQWRQPLEPGEAFSTVPAAFAIGAGSAGAGSPGGRVLSEEPLGAGPAGAGSPAEGVPGDGALGAGPTGAGSPTGGVPGDGASGDGPLDAAGFTEAVAALTAYRRALRRPHPDHANLPVVFNDYMNTLMGEPTTERLLPLVDAAADAGAEYFVIDAGWYADWDGWWNTVGEWEESTVRFPNGLAEVTDRIKERGMVPGLWLEPEVVGVHSPLLARLPEEAFFQRDGLRVADTGRHHLDFRHPAAVDHLDRVIDRLVADYGVGYFKLDYNVNTGPGTDVDSSPGAGLLGHERALLAWIDGVLDRHPGLTLESCASGGLRCDYGMLSRLQLQSTSDQQEHHRYPPITAAAPVAMTPEQAANWAYPQAEFTEDENAFALCNALLGRFYLSGHLDRMAPEQLAQVAAATAVYKQIRGDIRVSVPFWPLGLPGWDDSWVALGLRGSQKSYVVVWRRSVGISQETADQILPVRHLSGRNADVRLLFPGTSKAETEWDAERGELTVNLPTTDTACLITLE